MNKKYLPSEQFIARVIIIVIIITVVFGMYELVKFIKNKVTKKDAPIQLVIGDIIQKDSNNNGIADWEEYLWGLDPKKNGESNKEFITAKKETLSQSGSVLTNDSRTSATNAALSEQFFALIVSLEQSGQLDEQSIQSISDALGKTVEAKPINDIYTSNDLKIIQDSDEANINYFKAFSSLVTKYENEDIGSELTLISQGLGNNDPQALYAAKTVGEAYKSFGKELMQIPVPGVLSTAHVKLANDYEKTGESIESLTQILSDPIVGMSAIINYKKYSDGIVSDIDDISKKLQ